MRVLIDRLGQEFVLKVSDFGTVIRYRAHLDSSNDDKPIGSVMLARSVNKPMRLHVNEAWRRRGIMEQLLAHLHQDHPWDKTGEFASEVELGLLMVQKYWQTPPTVRAK